MGYKIAFSPVLARIEHMTYHLLRTRRALLLYKVYGDSALLALNWQYMSYTEQDQRHTLTVSAVAILVIVLVILVGAIGLKLAREMRNRSNSSIQIHLQKSENYFRPILLLLQKFMEFTGTWFWKYGQWQVKRGIVFLRVAYYVNHTIYCVTLCTAWIQLIFV